MLGSYKNKNRKLRQNIFGKHTHCKPKKFEMAIINTQSEIPVFS